MFASSTLAFDGLFLDTFVSLSSVYSIAGHDSKPLARNEVWPFSFENKSRDTSSPVKNIKNSPENRSHQSSSFFKAF